MFNNISSLPFLFWIAFILIGIGISLGISKIKLGIGIPMIGVLSTVFVWNIFDVMYNDYNNYIAMFYSVTLDTAWLQIITFLFVFIIITPALHQRFNKKYLKLGSSVFSFYKSGVGNERFQFGLTVLFRAALMIWAALLIGAIYRYKTNFVDYLFPYVFGHPGPWNESGIGGGVETFYALANYLQLMVASIFGVVSALSTNRQIRRIAFIAIFLSWPFYIFDRTRKFILVVALPGILAWAFLRLKGGFFKKVGVLLICFFIINSWFGFIIESRSTSSVTDALFGTGYDFLRSSNEEHQGLNMFEELCWISQLTESGDFTPEWGGNYFANLVNPVPRGLWPSKPTIGIDYAIARGLGGAPTEVGVYATLSNGLIGQGVANFGLYAGPAFAAFLMGLWAVFLARIDLRGAEIGYLPLLGLGLVLTFTMGRDITFLELYPFAFGYGICLWLNRRNAPNGRVSKDILRKLPRG